MKKIIACVLALILLVGAIIFNLPSSTPIADPIRVVAAPVPREGYILVPTLQGPAGVDRASEFILTSPYDNADYPEVSIDGQPDPVILRTGDNEFLITPASVLSSNSLYLFRLSRNGLRDLTWTFQTAIRFQVSSTLPGHQSTNVPVDTGIEITFSSRDFTDISDYFSIEPHVEGRFITRGATTVFMPQNPLSAAQLYTVTLRAGVVLEGTNEAITEDYIFAFETAPDGRGRDQQFPDTINFFNRFVEFPSFEPPHFNFGMNGTSDETINVTVYRFESRAHLSQSVRQLVNAPWWAPFARQNSLIDTSRMYAVMDFDITERPRTDG
ncbi:MAG: Ig-like domain-containing protein [Defluviitaleaceae bacterium]|nr:Ig-like domain-containing protein [Defluviitaleaceae bacterium]